MLFNHKRFFEGFKSEFDDSLNQAQVDGIEFLLTSFEYEPLWKDVRHIAYALATIYHETAASMQPVEEGYYLGSAARVKAFQKTLRYYPYYGRGYVQLTWNTKKIPNYQKASDALGVDFVKYPEKVLLKEYSFRILTLGMFQGWFTARKLRDYIHGSECDYKNARKIINGLDKANLIAGYARKFEQILKVSVTNPQIGSTPAPSADKPPISANTLQDNSSPSDLQAVEPPPVVLPQDEVTKTQVTQTEQGVKETVQVTTKNEQDVNVPAQVGSAKLYKDVGFIGALKKDFGAVGGGNLSFQMLQGYAQDASGWPPWVISLITKLATIVLILGTAWLLFRLTHYIVWKIGDLWRQKIEADINSDVKRKNVEFT